MAFTNDALDNTWKLNKSAQSTATHTSPQLPLPPPHTRPLPHDVLSVKILSSQQNPYTKRYFINYVECL